MNPRRAFILLQSILLGLVAIAQCPDSTIVLLETDFEFNNGGLIPDNAGDWEYGNIPSALVDSSCTGPHTPPPGAHSGIKGWGTRLNDCYLNIGTESTLSLIIDLTDPGFTSAELSFWQWHEVFVYYDYTLVRANGDLIFQNDTLELSTAWHETILDLSDYLGTSVEVQFALYATTVVNRAGWYLDDISVSVCYSGPSSISENENERIRIYPNPVGHNLTIEFPGSGTQSEIVIYGASGKQIYSAYSRIGEKVINLDLSILENGIYQVVVQSGNGMYTRKFIKTN